MKPADTTSSKVNKERPGNEATEMFRVGQKYQPQSVESGSISVNGWTAKVLKQKGAKY